ncbi:hypothetical protein PDO_5054 [Rhizobium sp. PDO1-076]|uniref:hypothetical protein n=1 Tax=Rhizobium sp. PDO1-076 TaxID=1125979 RepID=UPI00024E296F|nr:hypothetical protein [Rhizobium sp. PDO1-076]EHS51777.1 hypothetical protein PDO_5054 [Rhizobium sp. PDO1-076]
MVGKMLPSAIVKYQYHQATRDPIEKEYFSAFIKDPSGKEKVGQKHQDYQLLNFLTIKLPEESDDSFDKAELKELKYTSKLKFFRKTQNSDNNTFAGKRVTYLTERGVDINDAKKYALAKGKFRDILKSARTDKKNLIAKRREVIRTMVLTDYKNSAYFGKYVWRQISAISLHTQLGYTKDSEVPMGRVKFYIVTGNTEKAEDEARAAFNLDGSEPKSAETIEEKINTLMTKLSGVPVDIASNRTFSTIKPGANDLSNSFFKPAIEPREFG